MSENDEVERVIESIQTEMEMEVWVQLHYGAPEPFSQNSWIAWEERVKGRGTAIVDVYGVKEVRNLHCRWENITVYGATHFTLWSSEHGERYLALGMLDQPVFVEDGSLTVSGCEKDCERCRDL